MNEAGWKRLLRQIREGFVVPVVGAQLLVDAAGRSLPALAAERLLAAYGLEPDDSALAAFLPVGAAVARLRRERNASLQDLYSDVHDAIEAVIIAVADDPPPAIGQIAAIADFRMLVTTTPDDLLARCLRRRGAVDEIIHAPKLPTSEWHDLSADWGSRAGTAHLLYLFGKSRPAPVFAIHEEDVLEYAHNVIARGSQVPVAFLGALQERSLLLIGCSFPDWLGRFFLRLTNKSRLSEKTKREWLIEAPGADASGLTTFLRAYSSDSEVLSDLAPIDFVAELHRRWSAESGPVPTAAAAAPATRPAAMFFISYSRVTDQAAAQAMYDALRGLGVADAEVWFDREAIEPGERFRQRILDGIQGCRYFLPLLSAAADRREEGFFLREWREADDRASGMNRDFIVPIIVDAENDPSRYGAGPARGWRDALHYGHAPGGAPDEPTRQRLTDLVRAARRAAAR